MHDFYREFPTLDSLLVASNEKGTVGSVVLWCADANWRDFTAYNIIYLYLQACKIIKCVITITSEFLVVKSMPVEQYGRSLFDYF